MNALYETGLSMNGYVAGAMEQNDAVNRWIIFAYYGAYAIFAIIVFVVCIFFDAEKKMPEIHAELERRAKEPRRPEERFMYLRRKRIGLRLKKRLRNWKRPALQI